ncbi:MAG TPA: serine hydrolase domain-containing protein [Micromonosporaceae bacterium]
MSLLPETERALLHAIAVAQAEQRVPSLVAAVVRDGRTVWFGARGRVDGQAPTTDTQYRIGSITKSFVAVLVMRLRDEGRLDLDDRLGDHLPDAPLGDRTVRQLLSHSGGVAAEPAGEWWERSPGRDWAELTDEVRAYRSSRRGGHPFHYSNVGFALLGRLVSEQRGTSWTEALRTEILAPLEMRRTTGRPVPPHARGLAVHPWADVVLPEPEHDAEAMAPAGQLWSTATDLSRWAAFLGGDTGGVLNADTLVEMRATATVDDGSRWTSGYGLGLQLRRDQGRQLAGHTGSMPGFRAVVWTDPADGTAALALANSTAGLAVGDLGATLIGIVADREPRLPREWTPLDDVDPALLDLTGEWYWGPAPFVLRLLPDRWLSLMPAGQDNGPGRFRPEPDGTWTGLDGYHANETLRVVRRADGSVSHLDINTFVFTRRPYDPDAPVPGGLDAHGWRGERER